MFLNANQILRIYWELAKESDFEYELSNKESFYLKSSRLGLLVST